MSNIVNYRHQKGDPNQRNNSYESFLNAELLQKESGDLDAARGGNAAECLSGSQEETLQYELKSFDEAIEPEPENDTFRLESFQES